MPRLAPCPSGNLHPLTSIVPLPFLGRGRQEWEPREVDGFPQGSKALPIHLPPPEAEGGQAMGGGDKQDLGRVPLEGQGVERAAAWTSATRLGEQPKMSVAGGLYWPPSSGAGQRVGPRHSCGWEPRLEANGAEAAADATADARRPLHTHPSLPPPPLASRESRKPVGAESSHREGRLGGWGVGGGQDQHSGQWG